MGYSSKFWGSSLTTLQLHGWLGRGLYPCCILAFLDWNFKKKSWGSSTVTDRAAYWVAPSNPSHLQPQKIQDFDFRAPKRATLLWSYRQIYPPIMATCKHYVIMPCLHGTVCFNVRSTLWINVEIMLIRCWK